MSTDSLLDTLNKIQEEVEGIKEAKQKQTTNKDAHVKFPKKKYKKPKFKNKIQLYNHVNAFARRTEGVLKSMLEEIKKSG
jgi:hypothetical protein